MVLYRLFIIRTGILLYREKKMNKRMRIEYLQVWQPVINGKKKHSVANIYKTRWLNFLRRFFLKLVIIDFLQ